MIVCDILSNRMMALPTFIDNVQNLAIENCLLLPLENIFASSVINDMDESQIEDLASEPSFVQADRDMQQRELQKLQSALRACSQRSIRVPSRHSFGAADTGERLRRWFLTIQLPTVMSTKHRTWSIAL